MRIYTKHPHASFGLGFETPKVLARSDAYREWFLNVSEVVQSLKKKLWFPPGL